MTNTLRALARYLSAAMVVANVGGCVSKQLTVAAVDQQISDAVPSGTEYSRVLAILDSLRLEHSTFDAKSQTIAAMVPDNAKKGIITRTFHITFVFDSAGKLASHTVKEALTGP